MKIFNNESNIDKEHDFIPKDTRKYARTVSVCANKDPILQAEVVMDSTEKYREAQSRGSMYKRNPSILNDVNRLRTHKDHEEAKQDEPKRTTVIRKSGLKSRASTTLGSISKPKSKSVTQAKLPSFVSPIKTTALSTVAENPKANRVSATSRRMEMFSLTEEPRKSSSTKKSKVDLEGCDFSTLDETIVTRKNNRSGAKSVITKIQPRFPSNK